MVRQVANIGTLWYSIHFSECFEDVFPVSPCPWQVVEEAKLELKRRREEEDEERETRVRNIGAESVSEYFCLCGVCPNTGVYNYDILRPSCQYSRGEC